MLNADDEICRSFADLTRREAVWFSGRICAMAGLVARPLMPLSEIPIPGLHNAENVMAAAAAARHRGRSDCRRSRAAVQTFKAVEHRLEFVAEIDGVRFYNDSKATSVDATIKALDSFDGNLWVILGGKDKGSDYTVLRDRLQRKAHAALLIGAAAEKIAAQIWRARRR